MPAPPVPTHAEVAARAAASRRVVSIDAVSPRPAQRLDEDASARLDTERLDEASGAELDKHFFETAGPAIDVSRMSGVMEFIDVSWAKRSDEAGEVADELHVFNKKEYAAEEIDKVLNSMDTLLKKTSEPLWTCRGCEEVNCPDQGSCSNCGRDHSSEDGSQATVSRRTSREEEGEEGNSKVSDSEDASLYAEDASQFAAGSSEDLSEDASECADPGTSDDGDVKEYGSCCSEPSESKQPQEFASCSREKAADFAEASCVEDSAPHWTCLQCDEENRAIRAWCNNCGSGRGLCEPPKPEAAPVAAAADSPLAGRTGISTAAAARAHVVAEAKATSAAWTKAAGGLGRNAATVSMGQTEVCLDAAIGLLAPPPPCTLGEPVGLAAEKARWTCSQCDEVNRAIREECNNCGRPKNFFVTIRPKASPVKFKNDDDDGPSAPSPSSSYESGWNHTERPPVTPAQTERTPEKAARSWVDSAVDSSCETVHEDEEETLIAKETVTLHIYDVFSDDRVQAVNDVFRTVGTGAFHAGVEVFGQEWSFGCTGSGTGLVSCEPKGNIAHRYRESLVMGTTTLSLVELEKLLAQLGKEWPGDEYDLLLHNCCHFCDAFCGRLGVGPLPVWVTNLAGAGARLAVGVSAAASSVNEMAVHAAERAIELDRRYNILSTMETFTTREITIDESYLESKVQGFWTQAKQNIENVGKNIENASNDVKQVEANISSSLSNWWNRAAEPRIPPSKASPEPITSV